MSNRIVVAKNYNKTCSTTNNANTLYFTFQQDLHWKGLGTVRCGLCVS